MHLQSERKKERKKERQTDRKTERKKERQRVRKKERKKDRKKERKRQRGKIERKNWAKIVENGDKIKNLYNSRWRFRNKYLLRDRDFFRPKGQTRRKRFSLKRGFFIRGHLEPT